MIAAADETCGGVVVNQTNVTCPEVVACITAQPTGAPAAAGDLVLGSDAQFHALPAAADGSETKVTAGTNITVTGTGTVASPYVVNAAAATPQTLALVGQTLSLSGGGGAVTIPDSDAQTLSLAGNTLSLTSGGSVTLPAASVTFATPAQTIAGTSTTLAVNPADLYARENIAAQTGLGLVLSAIPAPTASQSNWGVNTLGETLHYMPGVGWKVIADQYGTEVIQAGSVATVANVWTTAVSLTMPRAGRIVATGTIHVENNFIYACAGGLAVNGLVRKANNSAGVGVLGASSASSTYEIHSHNAQLAWTGNVVAGDVLALQAITIVSAGTADSGTLDYTYL
jgi:hypothetical protein